LQRAAESEPPPGFSTTRGNKMRNKATLLLTILLLCGAMMAAQEATSPASTDAVQVIGFGDIKNNTKGTLELKDGVLYFRSDKSSYYISATAIQDVVTRGDTQRSIRGPVGTVSQLAPYGAGRVLSMFRDKIDTLTIEYRDPNGGLHGAIFAMAPGKAEPVKKELLAEGAQTTIPLTAELKDSNSQSEAQESQQ
jgi:hypothetical protein